MNLSWLPIAAAALFLIISTVNRPIRRQDQFATRAAGVAYFLDVTLQTQVAFDALGRPFWLPFVQQLCCVTAIAALCIMIGGSGISTLNSRVIGCIWATAVLAQLTVFTLAPPHHPETPYLDPVALVPTNATFMSISWSAMVAIAVYGAYACWKEISAPSSRSFTYGLAVTGIGALFALVAAILHFLIIFGVIVLPDGRDMMKLAVGVAATLIPLGLSGPVIFRDLVTRLRLWQVGNMWRALDASNSPLTAIRSLPKSRHVFAVNPRHMLLRRAVEVEEANHWVGRSTSLSPSQADILNDVLEDLGIA